MTAEDIVPSKAGDVMAGMDEFTQLFGGVTLSQVIMIGMAGVFLLGIRRLVKDYLDKRYKAKQEKDEAEKEKDEKLKTALEAIGHYPEYRKRSREIQEELKSELSKIRESLQDLSDRVDVMEKGRKEEDLHKLRDLLIRSYNYYASHERNPSGSWTRMESESFWELFHDYEAKGGDGYIHTTVQPAMERLRIIEMDDVQPRLLSESR